MWTAILSFTVFQSPSKLCLLGSHRYIRACTSEPVLAKDKREAKLMISHLSPASTRTILVCCCFSSVLNIGIIVEKKWPATLKIWKITALE